MIKIDVISGFLGAGKTTLIKKLLSEALQGQKVVLIENEFGEIGVDSGFLKDAGIEITEMNSGCICCSLVGDFGTALKEVVEKYHPERIIIEPSGVGKLSDVMKAIDGAGLNNEASLNSAVAVVDVSKAKMYIKNFGEFFVNQIENAGTIILSRSGNVSEEKLNKAISLIKEHNGNATIITTPWEQVSGKQILETLEGTKDIEKELMEQLANEHEHHDEHCGCGHHHEEHEHHHKHDEHCGCGHHHEEHEHHHEHDEHCGCGHHHEEHEHHHEHDEHCSCGCGHDHHGHHHADEVFTSWGKECATKYTSKEIENILESLEDDSKYGIVLRSKGIVRDADSEDWIYFDYTPGEINVRYGKPDVTGKICVIGSKLNNHSLEELFAK